MSSSQDIVRNTGDLRKQLDLEEAMQRLVESVAVRRPEHSARAHDVEWHAQGVTYHCRNLLDRGDSVGTFIRTRLDEGFERIVTRVKEFQELLFEFYALVNLSKIVLDELRTYLAPVFVTKGLPKSLNDILRVPLIARCISD